MNKLLRSMQKHWTRPSLNVTLGIIDCIVAAKQGVSDQRWISIIGCFFQQIHSHLCTSQVGQRCRLRWDHSWPDSSWDPTVHPFLDQSYSVGVALLSSFGNSGLDTQQSMWEARNPQDVMNQDVTRSLWVIHVMFGLCLEGVIVSKHHLPPQQLHLKVQNCYAGRNGRVACG
jgi:hypothetical protein